MPLTVNPNHQFATESESSVFSLFHSIPPGVATLIQVTNSHDFYAAPKEILKGYIPRLFKEKLRYVPKFGGFLGAAVGVGIGLGQLRFNKESGRNLSVSNAIADVASHAGVGVISGITGNYIGTLVTGAMLCIAGAPPLASIMTGIIVGSMIGGHLSESLIGIANRIHGYDQPPENILTIPKIIYQV